MAAGAVPSVQKAWIYRQFGDVKDVLRLVDTIPVPELTADQVLVKVKAVGLNPIDIARAEGKFKAVNDAKLPHIPGYDIAGVIVKLGSDVTAFKEGDEVYADVHESSVVKAKALGGLSEYTAVDERLVALKPKNVSFADAAGLPVAFLTAQGVYDKGNLKPGQSVLVLRGSGGVGTAAIQLAKKVYGASVVATTASSKNTDLVKRLGADVIIDYTTTNYWELPDKYDLVFDQIGESTTAAKAMKEEGVGASVSEFTNLHPRFFPFSLIPSGANLKRLNPHLENGELKPVQDPTSPYKFTEAREALAYLNSGRATGKVVIEL